MKKTVVDAILRILAGVTGLIDKACIPGVIVLWGNRSTYVRIFTNYLVDVREQEYQGYWCAF